MKKIISTVLVFAMMLSAVACSKETSKETSKKSKSDSTPTTKESVVEDTLLTEESETEATQVTSEPNQTLPSDANISETSETTEQPQPGKYTYTVYKDTYCETTFSLDYDIDEYIYTYENGNKFLDFPRLCEDLGYTIYGPSGKPMPEPAESDFDGKYVSFFDENRNMEVRIAFTPNHSFDHEQIEEIHMSFYDAEGNSYYSFDDIKGQEEYYCSTAIFSEHVIDCYIDGIWSFDYGLSNDDIVVLVYMMSFAKDECGKNPFFYTDFSNTCSVGITAGTKGYRLP